MTHKQVLRRESKSRNRMLHRVWHVGATAHFTTKRDPGGPIQVITINASDSPAYHWNLFIDVLAAMPDSINTLVQVVGADPELVTMIRDAGIERWGDGLVHVILVTGVNEDIWLKQISENIIPNEF